MYSPCEWCKVEKANLPAIVVSVCSSIAFHNRALRIDAQRSRCYLISLPVYTFITNLIQFEYVNEREIVTTLLDFSIVILHLAFDYNE